MIVSHLHPAVQYGLDSMPCSVTRVERPDVYAEILSQYVSTWIGVSQIKTFVIVDLLCYNL